MDDTTKGAERPLSHSKSKTNNENARKLSRRRAGLLNLTSVLIDQIVSLAASLATTPLIVSGLGPVLYGFWQFAQKVVSQAAMLNGRGSESLKYKVARSNSIEATTERQEAIGAALITLAMFLCLPLSVIVLMCVFIYHIPAARNVDPAIARLALLLLSVTMIIGALGSILQAVLRGMNQGYRRMGLRAGVVILGTILTILVLRNGGSIIGLSVVTMITESVTTLSLLLLVRGSFPWFRPAWPSLQRLPAELRQSIGFTAWGFVGTALVSGDLILVGFLLGPQEVTSYTLTKFAPQYGPVLAYNLYSALLPGIAGKIGEGKARECFNIHIKVGSVGRYIGTVVCVFLLCVNEIFVSHWVGSQHYLGFGINFLIVLATYQIMAINQESAFLNVLLAVRKKIVLGLISLSVLVIITILTVPRFGISGLCVAVLISRIILMENYPRLINRIIGSEREKISKPNYNQYVPVVIVSAAAALLYAIRQVAPAGTLSIIVVSVITTAISAILGLWLVVDRTLRHKALRVVSTAIRK